MITTAEGGVVMTNSEDVYIKSDGYTDHGHDHRGVDRGADLHPFIGYNFRISELHAAVGLAQIRKLDTFLALQKKNNKALRSYLEQIPEVTFRQVPEGGDDSCSFLSWFLPSAELMQAFVAEMKSQGILAGNFYWFGNNWHYIKQWQHLQQATTLNNISVEQKNALIALATQDFSASDAVMSCCISTAISLVWTDEQIKDKGEKMVAAIKKVLSEASVTI
jgi:8-amino-3,8-dideoxy-alpha-D-manno-octulosonate transaminase